MNLSKELPFWHFDVSDDLMVFKDGSLGAGFKLIGLDISCKDTDEINAINKKLENFLCSVEEGLKFQVFFRLTSNVKKLIDKHEEISNKTDEGFSDVAKARVDFFRSHEKEKSFFTPEIFLFVRSLPHHLKKQGLFEKRLKFETLTKNEYKKFKDKFFRNLKKIESSLETLDLKPSRLRSDEWFNLLFESLNFKRSENLGIPSFKGVTNLLNPSLNNQLCLTDFKVGKDYLEFNNFKFKAITMKLPPENMTYSSMIEAFLKLPFHFWISQNIHILDQEKERGKLQMQRRVAHSMASGTKNVSDIESESKFENLEDLLTELITGSEKLISSDFNVIIYGQTNEELESKTDEVLKAFRSLSGAEGILENFALKDIFFKGLPGLCEGVRQLKLKSSNVAHLMPLYGAWSGNEYPISLIHNRDGGVFSMNIFDSSLPSYNGIIFGGSGSGKSFSAAQIMLMFLSQKERPRCIWIDNGASSKRVVEALNGEFLDFHLDSGMVLNMFDLPLGETMPTPAKVKMLLAVLELILKEDHQKGLLKLEKALLEECIYKVYEVKSKVFRENYHPPTLTELKSILEHHENEKMRHFSKVLFSWSGNSAYGRLLDGQSNVKITKDIVSIEVQSLNANEDLKDVILLLLTSFIQDTASKDIERKYILLVDEAERLFKTELAKQFVITCYRTWRKYNSGIWSLSQNYKDFLGDKELADSLLPNAPSMIILRQRKIDWKDFQETFDFNDAQVEAVKSLEIVKGQYSELFYMQDERQIVLRLVPEPLSYWLCTSDGNDKAQIKNLQKKMPEASILSICKELANQR